MFGTARIKQKQFYLPLSQTHTQTRAQHSHFSLRNFSSSIDSKSLSITLFFVHLALGQVKH